MERKVTEKILAHIWKNQLMNKEDLRTSDGQKVQVIYPGWENDDRGPDFRDALIWFDGGELLKGDVEIHVTTRGWLEHGHDKDPNYDGVILEVVWMDGSKPTSNKPKLPTLALYSYLMIPTVELSQVPPLLPEPCQQALERYGTDALAKLLDEAGEERFHSKAEQFKARLKSEEVGQVLYRGIMRALGYARNKKPFEELARLLPLSVIEALQDHILVQALLLGTAGLLPGQRGKVSWDPWAKELERVWNSLGIEETMREFEWRFFKVRPENFPTRRIVAASYLLARHKKGGMFYNLLKLVSQGSRLRLEQGLMVSTDGYWASHFDFGVEGWSPSLIGRGRAREIVVNILLPFCFAVGEPRLREQALEIYRGYPRSGENRITSHLQRQIFGVPQHRTIDSALRQQGLIHLYDKFCAEHRCEQCPLSIMPT